MSKYRLFSNASRTAILLVGLSILLLSCSRKKKRELEPTPAAPTSTSSAPPFLVGDRVRLGPEQISKQLETVFGIKIGYQEDGGEYRDHIVDGYGVALGGIDYLIANKRDHSTRVQTLLILRSLSWQVTNAVITDKPEPHIKQFMTVAELASDRPFYDAEDSKFPAHEQNLIREGEKRWRAQIEEFHLRLYGRSVTESELEILKAAFLDAYVSGQYFVPQAWRLIFYSLVATMEFWST